MSNILALAQGWADRLVIDKTGLTDRFEILQSDSVEPNTGVVTGANDRIARFEDETGLRLISAKETVEVLVIDHAEKPIKN
jgi:uncharacterized protein (TIGR03435 family)